MTAVDPDVVFYGVPAMQQLTGATKRQVHSWTEQGWLRPEPRDVETSGVPLTYSEIELRVCERMVALCTLGFVASTAARVARFSVDHSSDLPVRWGKGEVTVDIGIRPEPARVTPDRP